MKIVFISNFLNHHQLKICEEFIEQTNGNFKFIATENTPDDRLKLGYDDMNNIYDFVIKAYESNEKFNYALDIAYNYDIVIIGSAPRIYINDRLKNNKIIFRYSERIFKSGFNLKTYFSLFKNFTLKERKNVYLLCSSAYTKHDFNIALSFINKCYKWGYFPPFNEYNIKNIMKSKSKNKVVEIIWVGRFIDWKHPEKVVNLAEKLYNNGIKFNITMIGDGPLLKNIKYMVHNKKLDKEVTLLGAVNNKNVRKYMENANIFLFTSDFNEGWGAVLNEAMNSGCSVVASHAIGSVPYLLKNNENGYVYSNDNFDDLYNKTLSLINNKNLQYKFGVNAYKTINDTWNYKVAVRNFITLANNLLYNKNYNIKEGPCSKAETYRNVRKFK